jgi:Activator of Hsp90 ATPase homolog 1-like protein
MDTDHIEKKILLRAPLKRVWRALADSGEFGTWFGMRFNGPFAPGAIMNGVIVPTSVNKDVARRRNSSKGRPLKSPSNSEPERLFSFRWHPGAVDPGIDYSVEPTTLVTFRLEQVADRVLTVTETGFDRIPLARRATAFTPNEQGFSAVINLIAEYLAHGS